ncbi:Basic-leucine zipper domain-containing protein [Dioscorea alata]|uniref:Basic-leucine zipper domain-containing protein n=1 Tax=Dioscorea alata TaxID=55571 RepID=A0ACB7TW08_DIOAL|nr:Basic-leucine zipper domain-containing protein [Dioscorea alata]
MAHLPPKVPNNTMTNNCVMSSSSFDAPVTTTGAQTSWVDEFLDFTSVKRSAHRRSVSDSVAFLEPDPMITTACGSVHEFDKLDDDQLISMFSDDMPLSSGGSASDHNSVSEEKLCLPSEHRTSNEAESICKTEPPLLTPPSDQSIMDPKRVKRILANRQSAQRSRVRKLQYISELERSVTTLQSEVSAMSPRVAFLDHQRSVLTVGNSHLKQRIAALAQDKIFKDAHQEALKKEIERLRLVYHQQSLKKMSSGTAAGDRPAVHTDNELVS